MTARCLACSSAAFKNDGRFKAVGLDGMRFKKTNGQKGNFFNGADSIRNYAKGLYVGSVNRVGYCLVLKCGYGQLFKGGV